MSTVKQDELSLWSEYGDLYNEIVRPERKYTISHYLRTQWGPLLGASRLWFVVALRQRCFWNNKQDWCVVDKQTLARESGLSLRTVNRIISAGDSEQAYTAWFFRKERRRRYSERIGRTVNAPNRYRVLLDDPLTPHDQTRLACYLSKRVTDDSPATTLRALQELCDCSTIELHEKLSPTTEITVEDHRPCGDSKIACAISVSPQAISLPTRSSRKVRRRHRDRTGTFAARGSPMGARPLNGTIPAAFALDVVQDCCPMPPKESVEYVEIARACSRLHNALTRPEHVYIGNQYFRLTWLPVLGPVLATLVVNLRARCYWNEQTGELRDTCKGSWFELAREIGCTARQLRNLRKRPELTHFMGTLTEGHGRASSRFRVHMIDPLSEDDQRRFEQQVKALPSSLLDPETGQLDTYPLLVKAERPPLGACAISLSPMDFRPRAEDLVGRTGEEILAHSELQDTQAFSNEPSADQGARKAERPPSGAISLSPMDCRPRAADKVLPLGACGSPCAISVSPSHLTGGDPKIAQAIFESPTDFRPRAEDLVGRTREDLIGRTGEEILAHSRHENTEALAHSEPDKGEILARGERKIWHIEGIKAEVLARQSGNSGTCQKLPIITPLPKGLAETALDVSSVTLSDPQLLAAAVLDKLLTCFAIQEPNKSKLLHLHPRCDWVVAWELYALTQPGLSENKAGYVYNRLIGKDPPPSDFVTLAALPPSVWRLFYHAVRRKSIAPYGQQHDDLVPRAHTIQFALWSELLSPVWESLSFEFLAERPPPCGGTSPVRCDGLSPHLWADTEDERVETESSHEVRRKSIGDKEIAQAPHGWTSTAPDDVGHGFGNIPAAVQTLLVGNEVIEREGDCWHIATPDLYQAWLLAHEAGRWSSQAITVFVMDLGGRKHPLDAEILALGVAPLPEREWDAVLQELRWQMTQSVFERWWQGVKPLGIACPGRQARVHQAGQECGDSEIAQVVLGVPTFEMREWLKARQMPIVVRTLSGVLGHPVRVDFVVYAERKPITVPSATQRSHRRSLVATGSPQGR